ncbi:MAG: DsbA family oxidoreductase [Novosphingobium sp.]|nr:DsbA family oxidoreductase [Novosphingobium sp.]
MTVPARLAIEIWSDVMCPWCIIGYKQLETALETLDGEVEANISWRPFELNPDLPEEGEDAAHHMMRKYGQEPSAGTMRQMQMIAEQAGYEMRFVGEGEEPPRRMWNTRLAHMLLHWALETGGSEVQTRLKLALFDAHFQQRRNISDREELAAIAESVGLDAIAVVAALNDERLSEKVQQDELDAVGKGINSVPMMLVEGRFMIPGAQDPETYAAYLRKVVTRMTDAA